MTCFQCARIQSHHLLTSPYIESLTVERGITHTHHTLCDTHIHIDNHDVCATQIDTQVGASLVDQRSMHVFITNV